MGAHGGDGSQPALEDFGVNAEREHIETAQLRALPPTRPRGGIEKLPVEAPQANVQRRSDFLALEQIADHRVAFQPVRRRAEYRDELRMRAGGGEHFLCLREVHRHARLAKDALADGEIRQRDRCAEVRRRADPDDVHVGARDQILPALDWLRLRRQFGAKSPCAFKGGDIRIGESGRLAEAHCQRSRTTVQDR